eukprot:CAMPEP_0172169332 /NCGR_PEP_ID=MMETSP1050-20130122/10645_1 /TAXON_ID=233186 /ORGANISM="Cryptomonas curvata, Strain CCAP979/52" /LENGTH=253 /DNA_ID=CAMNT_0012840375 /DNA_START=537 /DNA_END=1295 /DNA_ORIENTATION=-
MTSRIGQARTKWEWEWQLGGITGGALAAVCGISSHVGIVASVLSNARTVLQLSSSSPSQHLIAFNTLLRAGSVTGYAFCGFSVLLLHGLCLAFRENFTDATAKGVRMIDYDRLFQSISSFALGCSIVALCAKVASGIFSCASSISNHIVGQRTRGHVQRNSLHNPLSTAVLLGSHFGDGAAFDALSSLTEACCAAMLLGSGSAELKAAGWTALTYPLSIAAMGVVSCLSVHVCTTAILPHVRQPSLAAALDAQ